MTNPDLSVILNGHREGILAHHTLRTLHRSVGWASSNGLNVEVLVVLDNVDDATREVMVEAAGPDGYLQEVADARIVGVSVADLGLARNHGVSQARAPFIAVLDADNLPSLTWFLEGHRLAAAHDGPCVVHPEALVIFEGRNVIWPQWPTSGSPFRKENFYDQNYWDACCLAPREVFETHPYYPSGGDSGFGPEDWHWNTSVVYDGVPHLAAQGTALFYRAKTVGSLMSAHREGGSLIHRTPLLTDSLTARGVVVEARSFGVMDNPRRSRLLRRLTREAVSKKARRRQIQAETPPEPLSATQESVARLRPSFVAPDHYRYFYDCPELSDAAAVEHFRTVGRQAGRRGWLSTNDLAALHPDIFRVHHYRALHHDVVGLKPHEARLHWLVTGRPEGRRAVLTREELDDLAAMSLDDYRARYSDLAEHDDNQLVQHYLEWGRAEKRITSLSIAERTSLQPVAISDDLEREWRAMHTFEPWVPVPTTSALENYRYVGPPADGSLTPGSAVWWQAIAALGGACPDAVFFAPWLRLGGGDLLLAHYTRAVRQLRPDAAVVVVTTHGESNRLDLIDPSVTVVDLPSFPGYDTLTPAQRCRLVATLVTQLRPAVVHAFNSPEAFDAIEVYKRSIGAHTALFLSTFTIELGPDGDLNSHLLRRPSDYLDAVERVIVDSAALVEQFHELYRMDRDKFLPIRQPVDLPDAPMRPARDLRRPLRVLWAARFDRQKRLDLLADVAEAASAAGLDVRWDVYGEPVTGSPAATEASIARLETVGARLSPAYRSVDELPLSDIDVFLMTSETEGVPNTMLEMMARGVPFMGPLVGGLPEVLDERVGWPIERFDDVGAYVAALRQLAEHPEEARRRADAARELLAREFSWDAFLRRLEDVPGYLP